ncbi:hypothetical protein BS47DRAFT_1360803 [Hydnum rufescens UP504]|uniref:DUF7330 domain-containing protein n=1 Tax=Hydnum rufescens UP504 TaxID=1448309 RepID=A0A9P6B1D0_9AGAM|nr:hypothetical protein BS47DRAFT_1360803 [Hydnum rufescens UP504]
MRFSPFHSRPSFDPNDLVSTNFVSIFEPNSSIKGRWIINTSLMPPAALLAPIIDPGDIRPNLELGSQNGSINASVWLQGPDKDRAILDCSSTNGNVHLTIDSRRSQKVGIRVRTHNGSIKVFLPQGFYGPIEHRTQNGTVTFSPALRSSVTTISTSEGIGRSFVGNLNLGNLRRDSEMAPDAVASRSSAAVPIWKGDALEATTLNGSIYFAFEDEARGPMAFTQIFNRISG